MRQRTTPCTAGPGPARTTPSVLPSDPRSALASAPAAAGLLCPAIPPSFVAVNPVAQGLPVHPGQPRRARFPRVFPHRPDNAFNAAAGLRYLANRNLFIWGWLLLPTARVIAFDLSY